MNTLNIASASAGNTFIKENSSNTSTSLTCFRSTPLVSSTNFFTPILSKSSFLPFAIKRRIFHPGALEAPVLFSLISLYVSALNSSL